MPKPILWCCVISFDITSLTLCTDSLLRYIFSLLNTHCFEPKAHTNNVPTYIVSLDFRLIFSFPGWGWQLAHYLDRDFCEIETNRSSSRIIFFAWSKTHIRSNAAEWVVRNWGHQMPQKTNAYLMDFFCNRKEKTIKYWGDTFYLDFWHFSPKFILSMILWKIVYFKLRTILGSILHSAFR